MGLDIDVDADDSPVEEIQRRLRDVVLSRIPGSWVVREYRIGGQALLERLSAHVTGRTRAAFACRGTSSTSPTRRSRS